MIGNIIDITIDKLNQVSTWYFIGDTHKGNKGFTQLEPEFKKYLNVIRENDQAIVVIGGDIIEAIGRLDGRFDFTRNEPIDNDTINKQIDDVCNHLGPIKDKIKIVFEGNHERSYRIKHDYDIMAKFAEKIGFKGYKTGCNTYGTVRYRFEDKIEEFTYYMEHGSHSVRTTGGSQRQLQNLILDKNVDFAARGHSHIADVYTETRITPRRVGNKIVMEDNLIHCLNWGSWLPVYGDDYSSYAESCGYHARTLETVVLKIRPFSSYPVPRKAMIRTEKRLLYA